MAIIVSDTSPIRALDHLGKVQWLESLFGEVFVPPTVAEELLHPAARHSSFDVGLYSFFVVRMPATSIQLEKLMMELDAGEAEALALAQEIQADAVLIDELEGRKVAQQMGIAVIGTVGILLKAKQQGLCPAIAPFLDRLQSELGFFLSAAVRAQALVMAGERA